MAVRVRDEDVRKIVETASTTKLTPFIKAANELVDWLDSEDTDGVLSVAQLQSIELWLSAHYLAAYELQYASKKTGDASATFQGETGMYFDSTFYGQRALEMDVTGILAKRNQDLKDGGKREVSMYWLGKEPSEQDNYGNEY